MKRRFHLACLAVVTAVFLAGCSPQSSKSTTDNTTPPPATVTITQDVASPATWSAGNVYLIENSIEVTSTLTIEPGTIVKFSRDTMIAVSTGGSIIADGQSAATPIVFTSIKDDSAGGDANGDGSATTPAPGDWRGINITASGSVFNQCVFSYGGSGAPDWPTLGIENSSAVTITDCTFAHNAGGLLDAPDAAALNAGDAGAGTVITGNTFYDNDLPLVIDGQYDLDNSNVFHYQADANSPVQRNKYNGIFWYDDGSCQLTGHVTWSNTDAPYVITVNRLYVPASSSLTLADGVILKFDAGERLDVDGTLVADGTNGITFTSLRDDGIGGDTNGDGAATAPAPGDWQGLNVAASGSIFNKCVFSYGGSARPSWPTLMIGNSCTATITNCIFAHNAGGQLDDIRAATLNLQFAEAGTVVTGNTFYDNDMPMAINGLVSVDGSNVFHYVVAPENTVLKNKYNGIFTDGTPVYGNVTWSNTEVPYVCTGDLGIGSGDPTPTGTLTLGDNVILKLRNASIALYASGTLNQGTGDYFTSLNDDSLLGDTNADGDTSPAKGDWAGVNNCQGLCYWVSWGNILYATNP
jgi:hypothetical protein